MKAKKQQRGVRIVCRLDEDARDVDPLEVHVPRFFRGGTAESEAFCTVVIAAAYRRLRAPGTLVWSDQNERALQLALEHGKAPPSLVAVADEYGDADLLAERWGRRLSKAMNRALRPFASKAPLWTVNDERRELIYRTNPFALGWTQAVCRFFEAFRRVAERYRSARTPLARQKARLKAAQLLELWSFGKGTACPALSRLMGLHPLLTPESAPMLPRTIMSLRLLVVRACLEWAVLLAQMAGDRKAVRRWVRDLRDMAEVTSLDTTPAAGELFRAFRAVEIIEMGTELRLQMEMVLEELSSPRRLPG